MFDNNKKVKKGIRWLTIKESEKRTKCLTITRKSKSENGKSLHRAEEYGRMRRQLSGETNSNKVFLFEREFQWAFSDNVKVII